MCQRRRLARALQHQAATLVEAEIVYDSTVANEPSPPPPSSPPPSPPPPSPPSSTQLLGPAPCSFSPCIAPPNHCDAATSSCRHCDGIIAAARLDRYQSSITHGPLLPVQVAAEPRAEQAVAAADRCIFTIPYASCCSAQRRLHPAVGL
jgi:hypothetical protein